MKKYFLFLFLISLMNCKKDVKLISDNKPYQEKYISTIQVESYVNKIFIDLIGREPLNTEMNAEVTELKKELLSEASRILLIKKLQTNTAYLEGDSSYKKAYYHRFYDVLKLKMLEGAENDVILQNKGTYLNSYNSAVASGDSANAAKYLKDIQEIDDIISIPKDYENGKVTIDEIFIRLMDNYIYDVINMNTFNFVNATFDDLFFRLPTVNEYSIAFEMVENNQSGYLLNQTGTNKGEYLHLLVNSREFYEGLVIWTYKSLLVRNPKPSEVVFHIQDLINTKDMQKLQLEIMKTDEYANF